MGSKRIPSAYSLLHLLCALIVAFTPSKSDAQKGSNELDESNGPYFFYRRPEYPRDCSDIYDVCYSSNASGVFEIKPDGYPDSFEVYCDNDFLLGRWTVIQRRVDDSVEFNRDWQEYKNGFGFLSTEFWIGNEKLSYLTNQAEYELRIDVELSNGTSLFASHSAFRISDEWSQYSLVDIGDFHGDIDFPCPPNMIIGNCSCQPSCDDPSGLNNCNDDCIGEKEACVCLSGFVMKDGRCVLPNECGCYLTETNSVLQTGVDFVNIDCSEKCACRNSTLNCNSNYRCDDNAACRVQDGLRDCFCNEGYIGDGESCTLPKDCFELHDGHRQDGVYTILPTGWSKTPFDVYCDMTTAGGGWTLFQRRTDGVTNFYRNWAEYEQGFGSVQQGNDFWLGNEQLHYMTNQKSYKLRVDIVDSGGTPRYQEYGIFQTGDSSTKYRLNISEPSGNALNGMDGNDGGQFSTHNEDNDGCNLHDCAEGHKGGWWYRNHWCVECWRRDNFYTYYFYTRSGCYNLCTYSNLNGQYNGGNGKNIYWYDNNYQNLNSAEMKIRPSSANQ